MKKILLSITLILLGMAVIASNPNNTDESAVKEAINKAYVEALYNLNDIQNIDDGFHPEFKLLGLRQGELTKYTIDRWKKAIEYKAQCCPDGPEVKTEARFPMIDITGDAAVAKVQLYREGHLVFSEYISLYRFEDGWKIVSNIFQRH